MLHRPGWRAELHANGDFEVWGPNGVHWTTAPPGRVQARIPLPGADEVAGESPLQDHQMEFESAFRVLERVQRLKAEQAALPFARAIANLVALPPRRDWWNEKSAYREPMVFWQDGPAVPRVPPLTKPVFTPRHS
jgi:hypothetical protein